MLSNTANVEQGDPVDVRDWLEIGNHSETVYRCRILLRHTVYSPWHRESGRDVDTQLRGLSTFFFR